MEKALWKGKEIIASEVAKSFEMERAVRKASGRKELICPDENCQDRILEYCRGERRQAYFRHSNNVHCAYDKYDKDTDAVTKTIKRTLFAYFKDRGYDVKMDEKLIEGHYTHLVLRHDNKPYAIQIISSFSTANRIDDFFYKYKEKALPVFWIVIDTGSADIDISEAEMNYAKRFSINETDNNTIIAVDFKCEYVTIYRMDTNEYLYNREIVYLHNYPSIFRKKYPISELQFIDGKLTVPSFDIAFQSYLVDKHAVFEKKKHEMKDRENQRKEQEAQRQKELDERRKFLAKQQAQAKARREEEHKRKKEIKEKAEAEEKARKEQKEAELKIAYKDLSQGYEEGDRVYHPRYKEGKIIEITGNRCRIRFECGIVKPMAISAEVERGMKKIP